MVGFSDEEIIVGLAAKQGRIRHLANTITCNKRLIAGETIEDSAVTILQKDDVVKYQVDFREKDFYISPHEVLTHIYKYMHDIAASHCANVDESNTVITVPLGFSEEQRETVKKSATAAGFRVVQVERVASSQCVTVWTGLLKCVNVTVYSVLKRQGVIHVTTYTILTRCVRS